MAEVRRQGVTKLRWRCRNEVGISHDLRMILRLLQGERREGSRQEAPWKGAGRTPARLAAGRGRR